MNTDRGGRGAKMNPLDYGHPQHRPRLYFLGIHTSLIIDSGVDEKVVKDRMLKMELAMRRGHPAVGIDSVLVADDTPYISSFSVAAKAKVEQKPRSHIDPKTEKIVRKNTPKWVKKHATLRAQTHLRRGPSVDEEWLRAQPEYLVLPDRVKDMLDIHGLAKTDVPCLVEVSQSSVNFKEGAAMTVTPQGMIWISHRARLCRARDRMAIQGLFLSSDDYAVLEQKEITERQLQDLAGNAFCTASALPAALVVMITMGGLLMSCATLSVTYTATVYQCSCDTHCSATLFKRQNLPRHPPRWSQGGCDREAVYASRWF